MSLPALTFADIAADLDKKAESVAATRPQFQINTPQADKDAHMAALAGRAEMYRKAADILRAQP